VARVLILSSSVAAGHVGLSAAAPACLALGHAVTGLPTVLLSNHPGFAHVAGRPVAVDDLAAMADALAANRFLSGLDALLTGYLPSPAHVDFAVALIARARAAAPGLRVVVDPVLGDAPKGLYLPAEVAGALRDRLLPCADTATPNAFEAGWLAGRDVARPDDAQAAARALPVARVLVTSAPTGDPAMTGVLEAGASLRLWSVPRVAGVPHGVGDVFAGLVAAGLGTGAALGHLQALIGASLGAPHLRLESAGWRHAAPLDGV